MIGGNIGTDCNRDGRVGFVVDDDYDEMLMGVYLDVI